VTQIFFVVV